ncbi:hypothetical protein [Sphingomonas japonica]|uniref:Lipoprotein n=1 Tax=Sphingomonas japonica TaxID=511662 RepID=A0ABX0U260_9SPHN|nr:hypothetical protein [Sphingomonas japonica]NIJ23427.1 hypothetical protein [Sphingomonas japonica]
MIRSLFAPALLTMLAACGGGDDQGTSISLNTGEGNAATASVNGATGEIAVNVPGFKGKLDLPKFKLDAGDIDLNGVSLFPGSTVRDLDIAADRDSEAPNGGDRVSITFDSPAAAADVRQWFQGELAGAGYTLRTDGDGLVGTTEDGSAFRLDLTPGDGARSQGTITIGE